MVVSAPVAVAVPGRRRTAPETIVRGTASLQRLGLLTPPSAAELATTDPLTGLCSRTYFMRHLQAAIAQADARECTTLLYIDIDGFKQINDTIGPDGGSAVLCEVARRLTHSVRPCDVLARLDGDDFVVLTTGSAAADRGTYLARRIHAALEQAFLYRGQSLRIGSSFGIARFPQDARGAVRLLRCAESALCGAKQAGPGHHQTGRAGMPMRFAEWCSHERTAGLAAAADGL